MKLSKPFLLTLASVFALAVVVACSGAVPPAASAPTPVVEMLTSIPVPAPTSVPTPELTATPEPTPEPTATSVVVARASQPQPAVVSSNAIARMGEPAPDFKLNLFDGESLNLSDLQGNVVVLNFWASWCPGCRWEMPDFERISKEYQDRDVVFIGVAISDTEHAARGFAEKTGVTYALGLDETGQIARAYRPVTMPTTYFIDKEGNVSRKLVNVANETMLRLFLKGQLN